MKILLLGGSGFLGINLAIKLLQNKNDSITIVDANVEHSRNVLEISNNKNLKFVKSNISKNTNFDDLVEGQDVIYHMLSSTVPTTSNEHIIEELEANVILTAKLLDSCVRKNVGKVVFISSGGTVYGRSTKFPFEESMETNPISSYGVQKVMIEKLFYLYYEMYKLDYRIIRLANPYGPYQRPNGILGVVSTFVYKALVDDEITVYGDGSVIRDFIFIDDAISSIIKITFNNTHFKLYNLGSGYGTSISQVIETIEKCLKKKLKINYISSRNVDVPVNFLNMSRYENEFGENNNTSLEQGVIKTTNFMKKYYNL